MNLSDFDSKAPSLMKRVVGVGLFYELRLPYDSIQSLFRFRPADKAGTRD